MPWTPKNIFRFLRNSANIWVAFIDSHIIRCFAQSLHFNFWEIGKRVLIRFSKITISIFLICFFFIEISFSEASSGEIDSEENIRYNALTVGLPMFIGSIVVFFYGPAIIAYFFFPDGGGGDSNFPSSPGGSPTTIISSVQSLVDLVDADTLNQKAINKINAVGNSKIDIKSIDLNNVLSLNTEIKDTMAQIISTIEQNIVPISQGISAVVNNPVISSVTTMTIFDVNIGQGINVIANSDVTTMTIYEGPKLVFKAMSPWETYKNWPITDIYIIKDLMNNLKMQVALIPTINESITVPEILESAKRCVYGGGGFNGTFMNELLSRSYHNIVVPDTYIESLRYFFNFKDFMVPSAVDLNALHPFFQETERLLRILTTEECCSKILDEDTYFYLKDSIEDYVKTCKSIIGESTPHNVKINQETFNVIKEMSEDLISSLSIKTE